MRPHVPRFTRVVLCLLFLGAAFSGAGAAQETLLHAPRPTSPHWNHMNVLDYGWGAWNIADDSTRRRAYDWLASKADITMGPAAELKRTNPAIKTVSYDLDISICRHDDCYWEHGPNDQAAGLPEEFFLHFSQPTQLTFKGQDNRQLETVHIAGCPPGTPVNKACRVQFFMWTDSRWIFNPANENFRKWMARRLASNAADVLFLDEHAPGLVPQMSLADGQTRLIFGGGIYEYGGQDPFAANERYNADLAGALDTYNSVLKQAGKFLLVNAAEYVVSDPLAQKQVVGAKGASTEFTHRPDKWGDANEYGGFIKTVRKLTDAGVRIELSGSLCYYGPDTYTSRGNYESARTRYEMWRLASYYILREGAKSPGIVYFNPDLCVKPEDVDPLSFTNGWHPAYQADIGQPEGDSYEFKAGTSRLGCPYKIFARRYSRALVLVRPRDDWSCSDFGDASAVTVNLKDAMKILRENGSLSSPMTSVEVRNAEAVILIESPHSVDQVRR